jgi:membrane protein YqaA with SNARE-associated domain
MTDLLLCGGLFLTAFLAGSIFPLQSEAALAGLIVTSGISPPVLIATATIGNVLGSTFNWFLGRSVEHYKGRRWFPVGPDMLERAQAWYGRYGRWSLLLSWVPVIGDPLTVIAGVMKEPLPTFILMVAAAKLARYLVVAAVTLSWFG